MIIPLSFPRGFVRNTNLKCKPLTITCMTNYVTRIIYGDVLAILLLGFIYGVCLSAFGHVFLEVVNYKYLLPYGYAWDTGGGRALACNLAIFLCEIVTCMSYGATFRVIPIGYGVFPRRIYSDCTYQITSCQ